jgi:hypothetical protein
MENFPKNILIEAKDKMEESVYSTIANELHDTVINEGLATAVKKCLEIEKIKPVYLAEGKDAETFKENRDKLNKEAGLVIANHPGYFDSFLVLNALTREDIKIVVSESNFEMLSPIFGEEHLLLASKDPSDALGFLRSIKTHIEEGGLVILFPTGGADIVSKENRRFEFKDGLSVILRKCLKPTDMVYSFWIDPNDIVPLVSEKVTRHTGAASAFGIHESVNINKLKDEAEIKVDEMYSKGSDWQSLIGPAEKEDRNKILEDHYTEQFLKIVE